MTDIYRENLLDHYHNPKNKGFIENADIHKRDINVSCGDDVEIFIQLNEVEYDHRKKRSNADDRVVSDIKFQGIGCVICMASTSMLTEELMGKKISDIKKMNTDGLLELMGLKLTPTRVKCAMLPLVTMKKGILDYEAGLLNDEAKD